MKVSGKAVMRGSIAAGVVLLVVGVVWGNVYVTNKLIEENGDPVTITPTTPLKGERGDRGPQGEKGDTPTVQQVRQAVADYCAASGLCEGKTPSPAIIYAAVTRYCTENNCRGEAGQAGSVGASGRDGKDASPITDAQIQAQVTLYCEQVSCSGPEGLQGPIGPAGSDGRTPVINCVVRDEGSFIAEKYADEGNEAYRNLYPLPLLAACSNPVDVRGA